MQLCDNLHFGTQRKREREKSINFIISFCEAHFDWLISLARFFG